MGLYWVTTCCPSLTRNTADPIFPLSLPVIPCIVAIAKLCLSETLPRLWCADSAANIRNISNCAIFRVKSSCVATSTALGWAGCVGAVVGCPAPPKPPAAKACPPAGHWPPKPPAARGPEGRTNGQRGGGAGQHTTAPGRRGALGRLWAAQRRRSRLRLRLAPLLATGRRSRLRRGDPKGGQMASGGAARGSTQPHQACGQHKTEPERLWKNGGRGGGKTPVILYGGALPSDWFTIVNYICKHRSKWQTPARMADPRRPDRPAPEASTGPAQPTRPLRRRSRLRLRLAPLLATGRRSRLRRGDPKGGQMASGGAAQKRGAVAGRGWLRGLGGQASTKNLALLLRRPSL